VEKRSRGQEDEVGRARELSEDCHNCLLASHFSSRPLVPPSISSISLVRTLLIVDYRHHVFNFYSKTFAARLSKAGVSGSLTRNETIVESPGKRAFNDVSRRVFLNVVSGIFELFVSRSALHLQNVERKRPFERFAPQYRSSKELDFSTFFGISLQLLEPFKGPPNR